MKHLGRLLTYLKAHWPLVALTLAALGAGTGLNLLIPIIVRDAVDRGIGGGDDGIVALDALLILGVAALRWLCGFTWRYSAEWTAQRVTYRIRNQLYQHLQALHFRFYDRAQSGQLIARCTSDVEAIRHFFGMGIVQLVQTAGMAAATLVVLFGLDLPLALASMWTVPVLAAAVIRYADRVRRVYAQVQRDYAEVTTDAQENLAGIRVVRAFSAQDRESERFARDNTALVASNLQAARLWAFNFPLFTFIATLGTVAILLYGGNQVIAGEVSPGTFIAFNTYLAMLLPLVRNLGWLTNIATRALASGERIFEVLDTRPQIVNCPDARPLGHVRGDIRFEGVGFRYEEDDGQHVLHDIWFHIRSGETAAFIGTTGSGKSSIMNLLPRFYDVAHGRILIDGHDVRDVTLDSLRGAIAIVPQETFLFSTTLAENIAYARPEATAEEIERAARIAGAHEFISRLPEGYATLVGERGITLSGGQKQRIAIARAVLADPAIIIFDDSTSSVDTETEEQIQRALREVARDRTTIIIGQRVSSVMHADQIFVMDRGRIVERGTHADLLAGGRLYAEIVRLQAPEAEPLPTLPADLADAAPAAPVGDD